MLTEKEEKLIDLLASLEPETAVDGAEEQNLGRMNYICILTRNYNNYDDVLAFISQHKDKPFSYIWEAILDSNLFKGD